MPRAAQLLSLSPRLPLDTARSPREASKPGRRRNTEARIGSMISTYFQPTCIILSCGTLELESPWPQVFLKLRLLQFLRPAPRSLGFGCPVCGLHGRACAWDLITPRLFVCNGFDRVMVYFSASRGLQKLLSRLLFAAGGYYRLP